MKGKKGSYDGEVLNVITSSSSLVSILLGMLCACFFGAGLGKYIADNSRYTSDIFAVMCALIAAAANTLVLVKPLKKIYPAVPAVLAVITALIGGDKFLEGLKDFTNSFIAGWNEKFSDAVSLYAINDSTNVMFLLSAALLIAAIANLMVMIDKPVVSMMFLTVMLLPALVTNICQPECMGFCFVAALLQKVYSCDKTIDVRKIFWTIAVSATLFAVAVIFGGNDIQPVDDFRHGTIETVNDMRYGEDSLPKGDLSKAYLMNVGKGVKLTVNQSSAKTLYLKGFVGADYANGKWTELTRADFRGENVGIEDWLVQQDFTPVQQYHLYQDANGGAPAANKVTVENVGADRRYVYLPYSAYNISCGTSVKHDAAVKSDGFFGADSYTFTERSDIYPGELLYAENWIEAPDDDKQKDYADNEAVYRSFVYKSYLSIDSETKESIQKLFVDTYDEEQTKTVYNVTQHIHRVLENSSNYSLKPTAEDAKTVNEFLEGGTGNSALYASSAVLAYRAFGIPARYAEGYYISGENVRNNVFAVLTATNAHSWVEVYSDGIGWVPVDVTPGFYYDVYSLQQMIKHPENVQKTAVIEDDGAQSDLIKNNNSGDRGRSGKEIVKNVLFVVLGVIAALLILAAFLMASLEIRTAILTGSYQRKYLKADPMKKQQMICEAVPRLLGCVGIETSVGWHADEVEKQIMEIYDDVYEGEFVKVNRLMEKCIYGEEELPPHELRMMSAFTMKIANFNRKTFKRRQRFRMKYFIYPRK